MKFFFNLKDGKCDDDDEGSGGGDGSVDQSIRTRTSLSNQPVSERRTKELRIG